MSLRKVSIGLSRLGHPLNVWELSPSTSPKKWVFLLGGVHGDEIEGVWLCNWAVENGAKHFKS